MRTSYAWWDEIIQIFLQYRKWLAAALICPSWPIPDAARAATVAVL
jgi:hypothetical protein